MLGDGPMPWELQLFLAATGERAMPWGSVFGEEPLTVAQFELYSYMQTRVLQAATEEGRKELARDRAVDAALAAERVVAQGGTPALPFSSAPPFDPSVMSAEEIREWLARYGSNN